MRTSSQLILGVLSISLCIGILHVSSPPPAEAIPQCRCTANTLQTGSGTVGGSGYSGPASCAAAEQALIQQLRAQTTCPSCNEQLIVTQACQMDDPKWFPVTGYLKYGCEVFC